MDKYIKMCDKHAYPPTHTHTYGMAFNEERQGFMVIVERSIFLSPPLFSLTQALYALNTQNKPQFQKHRSCLRC